MSRIPVYHTLVIKPVGNSRLYDDFPAVMTEGKDTITFMTPNKVEVGDIVNINGSQRDVLVEAIIEKRPAKKLPLINWYNLRVTSNPKKLKVAHGLIAPPVETIPDSPYNPSYDE